MPIFHITANGMLLALEVHLMVLISVDAILQRHYLLIPLPSRPKDR